MVGLGVQIQGNSEAANASDVIRVARGAPAESDNEELLTAVVGEPPRVCYGLFFIFFVNRFGWLMCFSFFVFSPSFIPGGRGERLWLWNYNHIPEN